eukprot:5462106-Alexandrium_andersonii.AAC.1
MSYACRSSLASAVACISVKMRVRASTHRLPPLEDSCGRPALPAFLELVAHQPLFPRPHSYFPRGGCPTGPQAE